MSESENEEFDKEAEKRRLREKYEADREQREATSRMSDLLLQGATMTNKHCDRCGDPLFRHQGQEFCPSCQAEGDAATAAATDEREPGTAESSEPDTAEHAAVDAAQTPEPPSDAASATHEQTATAQGGGVREAAPTSRETRTGTASTPRDRRTERRTPAPGSDEPAAVADARADLADAVSELARRAAAADDPRQARELAEAAREAADGLNALR